MKGLSKAESSSPGIGRLMWATVAAGIPGAAKESRFESHSSVPPAPTRSTCSSSLSGSDPWPLPSFGDQ